MKKLALPLCLALLPAWGSLVQIFGLNPDVVLNDQMSRNDCKQFQIVSAYSECLEVARRWDKLNRSDTEKNRKLLAKKQQNFFSVIQGMERVDSGRVEHHVCFSCNPDGVIDNLNQANIENFQKILSCESDYNGDLSKMCNCSHDRDTRFGIEAPSPDKQELYDKHWGKRLGDLVSAMIYSTLAEIGDVVAEGSITGHSFNTERLPSCDTTLLRKTVDHLRDNGCPNGTNVNRRLSSLFPEKTIDAVLTELETKTIELMDSGFPMTPDPAGHCTLPRQYFSTYRKGITSGVSRCLLQAIKVIQQVIPEEELLDTYRQEPFDPFNKILENSGEPKRTLPEGVTKNDYDYARLYLAQIGNSVEGGKIFYNCQSWEGARSIYHASQEISGKPDYANCESPDSELSAMIQTPDFNREYERNLERKCDHVFNKLLEKAICDPLGSPGNDNFLELPKAITLDPILQQQLLCSEDKNGAMDIIGSKANLFPPGQSVESILELSYFKEDEYREFNSLCPLLKKCEEGQEFCTVRSFASITDEEYAALPDKQKKIVDKYRAAEEAIEKHINNTRSTRKRSREQSEPDDIFSEAENNKDDINSASASMKINEQENREKEEDIELPHFMQSKEQQLENAQRELATQEKEEKRAAAKGEEYKPDYGNSFVNQLIYGAQPIEPLKPKKRAVIPLRHQGWPSQNSTDSHPKSSVTDKQEKILQGKIDELKNTMDRMDRADMQSSALNRVKEKYQREQFEQEQASIDKERAAIARERELVQDATQRTLEQQATLKKQAQTDKKVRQLESGLQKTREAYEQREIKQQEQISQLMGALEKQANLTKEKDREVQSLQTQIERMMPRESDSSPGSTLKGAIPRPAQSINTNGDHTRSSSRQAAHSTVARGSAETNRLPVNTFQNAIPTISSKEYISLKREENLLERGVNSGTPSFKLKTYDIHGNQIEIPMKAEFDSKGKISKIVPDLRPEHHALINSIRDRAVRENLLGLVENNTGVQLISETHYLRLSVKEIISQVGDPSAFNVLIEAKDGTHLVIPFQVLRRGSDDQKIRIHLDYQNYPWMKDSLARIKNPQVLERIYLQMEKEDL